MTMTPEEKKKNDKRFTRLFSFFPTAIFLVFVGGYFGNFYVLSLGFLLLFLGFYLILKFVKPNPKCDTCGGTGIKK